MANEPAADAEETLWTGSVSHWHYAGKWFFVLVFLVTLAGTFFVSSLGGTVNPWVIRAIPAVGALVLLVWIQLDRSRRRYLVTNRRVSVEYGIVSKRSVELRIQDIRSINLTTTGLPGLVGIGRVEFSSAATDDADVIFWNTPGAEKIRDLVRSLQTVAA